MKTQPSPIHETVLGGQPSRFPLFHRIVVPVDGSPASDNAVAMALSIGQSLNSEIQFIFVVDSEKLMMDYQLRAGVNGVSAVVEQISASGRELLDRISKRCRALNVKYSGAVLSGDVVGAILLSATEFGADAIITATHGRRALESPHLGGRTQDLLRRSTIPVLVVRLSS